MRKGRIEVITGGMFSGKSTELQRRIDRSVRAGLSVVCFKPAKDNRYSDTEIVSHDQKAVQAIPINAAEEVLEHLPSPVHVVAIDEAQFFDASLVEVCNKLANLGVVVLTAGLDMDSKGVPYDPMPELLAVADGSILKLTAICSLCGDEAQYSFCRGQKEGQDLVAGAERYQPMCRDCFNRSGGFAS